MGDRLQQTVNGVPTNYILDLNTGLTQVLSNGTTTYTYGVDRISQQNGNMPEYFLGDALDSVRQITDQGGAVTMSKSYDPYGVMTQTGGTSQSAYGYTGEQTDSYIKLINLRSRLYSPTAGRFISRDTWAGNINSPMSFDLWNYVRSNPVNYTDPTGYLPLSRGYLEGVSNAIGFIEGGSITGSEIVYDYATMTRARFSYSGTVGFLITSDSWAAYSGIITGLNYPLLIGLSYNQNLPHSQLIVSDYRGPFDGVYAGISVTLTKPIVGGTAGLGYFQSASGGSVKGVFSYLSIGVGWPMPGEIVGFHTNYDVDRNKLPGADEFGVEYYYDKNGHINRGKLISDILSGDHSPIPLGAIPGLMGNIGPSRSGQIGTVLIAAHLFEKYYSSQYQSCNPYYYYTDQ